MVIIGRGGCEVCVRRELVLRLIPRIRVLLKHRRGHNFLTVHELLAQRKQVKVFLGLNVKLLVALSLVDRRQMVVVVILRTHLEEVIVCDLLLVALPILSSLSVAHLLLLGMVALDHDIRVEELPSSAATDSYP